MTPVRQFIWSCLMRGFSFTSNLAGRSGNGLSGHSYRDVHVGRYVLYEGGKLRLQLKYGA